MAKKEIATIEVDREMPLEELMESVYPRALEALLKAKKPEDVNEIRIQIGTVVEYINKKLPSHVKDRKKRLVKANKGNRIYIEACIKAGLVWMRVEKHRGRPKKDDDGKQKDLFLDDKSVQDVTLLTAEEAGFIGRRDAQQCVRAAKLHDEDIRVYYNECDINNRQYTLNGLESVWRELNPSREGANVPAIDPPISERLGAIVKKVEGIYNELPDGSDDAKDLLEGAIENLKEAAEIME